MTYTIPQNQDWNISTPSLAAPKGWLKSLRCFGQFSYDLGIDLGTSNTVIHIPERGIVVQEPSMLVIHKETLKPIAFGEAARQMLGRNADDLMVRRPLRNGVVADFEQTKLMLQHFIQQAQGASVIHPRIAIGVSSGATQVERWALVDIALQAGARKAFLVEEPIASAIGAGLSIDKPFGNLIVDIGGGTTEVAVVSCSGIVVGESIPIAGNVFDQAIRDFFRHSHDLRIGELTAERIKVQHGSAFPNAHFDNAQVEAVGLNLKKGLTGKVSVLRGDLREALAQPLSKIVGAIKQVIEQTSPERVSDICDRGIVLTGGGALLSGLDTLLSKEMGMIVHVPDQPLGSVAIGASSALQNRQYESVLSLAS